MPSFLRRWLRGSSSKPIRTSSRPSRFRPALDLLETREVPTVITVTGTGDTIANDGFVTLREAITAANTNAASGDAAAGTAGLDVIKFNISGAPGTIHTIKPQSALPSITDQIIIDGYSQLGATANTAANGTNAFLAIELNGTNAGFNAGLHISAGNSIVQGLVINRFSNEGILITGKGGNVIRGNFLGTDATGQLDRGNGISGVAILTSNNRVGGTALSDRNLISGNDFGGVTLLNSGISGNLIQRNLIGTDDTGGAPLANNIAGVRILNVTGNTVGGTQAGAGNVIAYNGGPGVQVSQDAGLGNAILGNSIFGNGGLGIDLNNDGVTPNDPFDVDSGPNNKQNYPVVNSAISTGGVTTISGVLRGALNATFRVEFFSSSSPDASGFGEGQKFIGATTVTTNGLGFATFSFKPASPVQVGKYVAATATDALNNTSEFSRAVLVNNPVRLVAVGAGAGPGAAPHVKVYDTSNNLKFSFYAFDPGFAGGVRVATADVTGDGVDDIVAVAGPGAPGGHVKVYDGTNGALIQSYLTFPGFAGGVNVAAGDVNGDGLADIIVTPAANAANGHVKVFDGQTGSTLQSFFAFPGFIGGVTLAAGDLDGDGKAEIIVGSGAGSPSGHVKAFDGTTAATVRSFLAFPGFNGGVNVAAGDFDGDGRADIVTSVSTGPTPHVKVLRGTDLAPIQSFFTFAPGSVNGLRIAADDIDGDGKADIIAGSGSSSQVRVIRGTDLAVLDDFLAFGPGLPGGVFVG